ncbi:MAG TPA: hypothetical protein DCS67_12640 [Clostridiales bacterium UBA8960]|nr:hypothetical protein [Clostridiales bacterium UBA8960]
MKKFKFRYESVLKMRLDQEDKIKNDLAKLITRRQRLIDQLIEVKDASALYDKHIQDSLEKGESRSERHQFSQGKQYYRDKTNNLNQQLAQINQDIIGVQQKLVEAVKDRKVMDKLKEKAFKAFVEAINEADEKLIEEVVNFANNKRNGE